MVLYLTRSILKFFFRKKNINGLGANQNVHNDNNLSMLVEYRFKTYNDQLKSVTESQQNCSNQYMRVFSYFLVNHNEIRYYFQDFRVHCIVIKHHIFVQLQEGKPFNSSHYPHSFTQFLFSYLKYYNPI